MSSLVQKRNLFALTLIIVTDDGKEEPLKVRVLDRRKGLDFMVPLSTKSAIRLAESLLTSVRRRHKGKRKPLKPKDDE